MSLSSAPSSYISADEKATLMLRLPNGQRDKLSIPVSSKLMVSIANNGPDYVMFENYHRHCKNSSVSVAIPSLK